MPKVSFILPAYKRPFLKEAIASILAQTYTDFDLVIVDDASPENLKEVVDTFHDPRLTYHRNAQNIGGKNLVAAWTKAMEYATGEFCVLASDDDMYHPDYLKTMLDLSVKYPEVNLFHCRSCGIDRDGNITNYGDARSEYETVLDMLYYRGVKRYFQVMPDFMFRISAWKEIGGFVDFPVAFFSDDATWFALSRKNGAVCSNRPLFFMRDSGINVSSSEDNIVQKVEATIQYLQWSKNFIKTISVTNDSDIKFKKYIESRIENAAIYFLYYLLKKTDLSLLVKVIKDIQFPNRCVRNNVIRFYVKSKIDNLISILSFHKL